MEPIKEHKCSGGEIMAISGYLCPKCGSRDVYRSRRRGLDKLWSIAGFYPFSCEETFCKKRFYRRTRRFAKPVPTPWKTE
jgi:anaerobic ribonucleoside-triphosphate reductase